MTLSEILDYTSNNIFLIIAIVKSNGLFGAIVSMSIVEIYQKSLMAADVTPPVRSPSIQPTVFMSNAVTVSAMTHQNCKAPLSNSQATINSAGQL